MNTYGSLPNASLLHTYGFTEPGNPHDVVGVACLRCGVWWVWHAHDVGGCGGCGMLVMGGCGMIMI